MTERPLYCPSDLVEDEDCPACGEPPSGVCRAVNAFARPEPLVEVVLVDRWERG